MSSDEFSEAEYEIEQILKHRKKGRNIEYYVSWKGFNEDENEWVKESDILSKSLVSDYERSLKKTPSRKASTKVTAKSKSASQVTKSAVKSSRSQRTASLKSNVLDSETSDVEILDETPFITHRSTRTETKTWHSTGGAGDSQMMRMSEKSFTSIKESSSKRPSHFSQLSQDIPFMVFVICLLVIFSSFVFESFNKQK